VKRFLSLFLLPVIMLVACEAGVPSRDRSVPSSIPPSPTHAPWSEYPRGWTEFPAPPKSGSGAAWLWTGAELLVVGGCDPRIDNECREMRRALAFDPTTQRWRRIVPALRPTVGADAVWTGEDAVFLETYGPSGEIVGQAYRPTDDEWRLIPRPPLSRAYGVITVWTGAELILWGGGDRGDPRAARGAAYDPASQTWRRIARAPVRLNLSSGVWTGEDVIVFGSLLNRKNWAATPTSVGAAYDPSTDTWQELKPSALSPQATSAVWLEDRLVAWDYQTDSQEYDPVEARWSAPVSMPIARSECYPDSTIVAGLLFAWFCGDAALYDENLDAWQRLDGGPLDDTIYSEAYRNDIKVWRFADLVSAGTAVVMELQGITLNRRGVACYGCEGAPRSYWVYRPPSDFAPEQIVEEVDKPDVRRILSEFLYAWQFDVDGLLPWFVTVDGLRSFEAVVPADWLRSTYRIDRVRALGSGAFVASVRLFVRDEAHRGADALATPLSLEFGPGISIGGESAPLLLTNAVADRR
jgi:hypothetical protein